jgi:hypothetical protein
MVARDTGCRPHEIVNMKNKDLVIQRMDDGSHVAMVTVNGSFLKGKKEKSRNTDTIYVLPTSDFYIICGLYYIIPKKSLEIECQINDRC